MSEDAAEVDCFLSKNIFLYFLHFSIFSRCRLYSRLIQICEEKSFLQGTKNYNILCKIFMEVCCNQIIQIRIPDYNKTKIFLF